MSDNTRPCRISKPHPAHKYLVARHLFHCPGVDEKVINSVDDLLTIDDATIDRELAFAISLVDVNDADSLLWLGYLAKEKGFRMLEGEK